MVLPLVMKIEKNFKLEKILKHTQFCYLHRALGKVSAVEAFEAGDFS